jgi:C-terminal processing protease CtpA/Prc
MKKRLSLAIAFALCLSLLPLTQAKAQAQPVNDEVRIGRLAALCKLWGTVKFFHPYLAYKDIDWDAALIQAIPKVSAARSKEEYKSAIDSMLASLKDASTRTASGTNAPAAKSEKTSVPQPYIKWIDDQTAVIVATDHNQFVGAQDKAELFRKVFTEAQKAKAVVLDIRPDPSSGENFTSFWFNNFFSQSFPLLLSENFPESSIRYRLHSGFAPQSGTSSGGYFSALVTRDGSQITARGPKEGRKPMAILINSGLSELYPMLGGLQAAGLAKVIREGDSVAEGGPRTQLQLTDGITAYVRTGEIVNPDGSLGFQPDITIAASAESSQSGALMDAALKAIRENAVAKKERQSAPQVGEARIDNFYRVPEYPEKEYRLLALFRFWNVINYFNPYNHLMDKPWDSVLTEYIPKMEAAKDALDYHLTVAEMVTNLQDTHGFMTSPVLSKHFGTHVPPMEVRLVEGQTVITKLSDEALKEAPELKVGDEIISVDGEEISKRRERIGRYVAVSTPQALRYRVNGRVLAGAQNSKAALQVKGKDGKIFDVQLTRSHVGNLPKKDSVYKVLPEGYGYFDLTRLTRQDFDAAFDAVKDTPALILDMRGYPRGIFFMLGMKLTTKRATAALFERPEIHAIELGQSSRKKFEQTFFPMSQGRYAGKVVMLINEEAISQSEHTCLFVEAATDVTFVGSPTNGANGDVTSVGLPGGLFVNFTGHDVRHGDGRQLQRVGIQPHIKAEPTIKGIREGKDEVLESAIEFLRKSARK